MKKLLLLSAAISFGLNVIYTGILVTLNYLNLFTFTKDSATRIPFYFSVWVIKTVYPQIIQPGKRNIIFQLFGLFIIYLLNTIIYALPIYGILRFFTRKKQAKQTPSAEPPPPPAF